MTAFLFEPPAESPDTVLSSGSGRSMSELKQGKGSAFAPPSVAVSRSLLEEDDDDDDANQNDNRSEGDDDDDDDYDDDDYDDHGMESYSSESDEDLDEIEAANAIAAAMAQVAAIAEEEKKAATLAENKSTHKKHSPVLTETDFEATSAKIEKETQSQAHDGFSIRDIGDDGKEWNTIYDNPFCSSDVFPVCTGRFEEQLEVMTRCRHPLALFSVFEGSEAHAEVIDSSEVLTSGAYIIPKDCEYCGAETTALCPDHCARPRLFLQKKRPPLCPPGPEWDPITDFAIPVSRSHSHQEFLMEDEIKEEENSTWMSGIFGSSTTLD